MAVDRDKLALYVMGELDDPGVAEVERNVAEDPEWAAALAEEARLELALLEVAEQMPAVPTVAPALARAVPWWRSLFAPMAGAMALAAVAMVMMRAPPPSVEGVSWSLEVRGGEAAMRSVEPSSATPTYTKGSRLSLLLRPSSRTDAPQGVTVILDGFPVDALLTYQEGGGVELIGVFGENLPELSAGEHLIELMVPGQPPLRHVFQWKDPAP